MFDCFLGGVPLFCDAQCLPPSTGCLLPSVVCMMSVFVEPPCPEKRYLSMCFQVSGE